MEDYKNARFELELYSEYIQSGLFTRFIMTFLMEADNVEILANTKLDQLQLTNPQMKMKALGIKQAASGVIKQINKGSFKNDLQNHRNTCSTDIKSQPPNYSFMPSANDYDIFIRVDNNDLVTTKMDILDKQSDLGSMKKARDVSPKEFMCIGLVQKAPDNHPFTASFKMEKTNKDIIRECDSLGNRVHIIMVPKNSNAETINLNADSMNTPVAQDIPRIIYTSGLEKEKLTAPNEFGDMVVKQNVGFTKHEVLFSGDFFRIPGLLCYSFDKNGRIAEILKQGAGIDLVLESLCRAVNY